MRRETWILAPGIVRNNSQWFPGADLEHVERDCPNPVTHPPYRELARHKWDIAECEPPVIARSNEDGLHAIESESDFRAWDRSVIVIHDDTLDRHQLCCRSVLRRESRSRDDETSEQDERPAAAQHR